MHSALQFFSHSSHRNSLMQMDYSTFVFSAWQLKKYQKYISHSHSAKVVRYKVHVVNFPQIVFFLILVYYCEMLIKVYKNMFWITTARKYMLISFWKQVFDISRLIQFLITYSFCFVKLLNFNILLNPQLSTLWIIIINN